MPGQRLRPQRRTGPVVDGVLGERLVELQRAEVLAGEPVELALVAAREGEDLRDVHPADVLAVQLTEQRRDDGAGVVAVRAVAVVAQPPHQLGPRGDEGEFDGLTGEDFGALQFGQAFSEHAVHDRSQQAQPQTLAHALADSPAGQLAWSGQLFGTALSPEDVLTNAALYWFTNTAASSARFYYENHRAARNADPAGPTTVPIGLAAFAFDFHAVRRFAERDHHNIVAWNTYDRGGHWATHDAPDLLVEDIRQFFAALA